MQYTHLCMYLFTLLFIYLSRAYWWRSASPLGEEWVRTNWCAQQRYGYPYDVINGTLNNEENHDMCMRDAVVEDSANFHHVVFFNAQHTLLWPFASLEMPPPRLSDQQERASNTSATFLYTACCRSLCQSPILRKTKATLDIAAGSAKRKG